MSDPVELQGRGGGVGRYSGLTIEEICDRFSACEADPSMRSLSAVLRITREQLEARGHLGAYPVVTAAFASLTAVAGVASFAVAPELQTQIRTFAYGGLAVTGALLLGVWHARDDRKASVRQEREIKRMAANALETILATSFKRKPLLREQIQTIQDVLKQEPRPALHALLQEDREVTRAE